MIASADAVCKTTVASFSWPDVVGLGMLLAAVCFVGWLIFR